MRLELQADCYSGVWASTVFAAGDLEQGDLDEAFTATEAVGDDRLQRQAGQKVNPDSFTHGTSEQRRSWFEAGYESGEPAACDTFSAESISSNRPPRGVTIAAWGSSSFFSRRRDRESATSSEGEPAVAAREGQPVVGQQVGGAPGPSPRSRADRPLAARPDDPVGDARGTTQTANVTIEQGPSQTIDMRGSGLREEIFEIMRRHGIDPESGTASKVDAAALR